MSRVISPFAQFFDGEGVPLADGWLRFLVSGTNNTLKNTYADVDQLIANSNPLQLDAEGRCPNVFGQGIYRVVLYADNPVTHIPGELIQSFDPVSAEFLPATVSEGNFSEWSATVTYQVGEIVIRNSAYYRSITADNFNHDPELELDQWEKIEFLRYWNSNVTYALDNPVIYDANIWFSLQNSNLNNQPDTSPLWWESVGSGTVLTSWEEFGTALRPVVAGYDLGTALNYIGTAYIQSFGSFPLTPSSDPTLDYHVANKLYVDNSSAGRMQWLGDWVSGTYEANDTVIDDTWTMVAIAQTDERPSPQPIGDPEWIRDLFSPPAFSSTSANESVLYVGQRYDYTSPFLASDMRVYFPAAAIDLEVKIWAIFDPAGTKKIIYLHPGFFIDDTLVEKWIDIPFASIYVPASEIVDIVMVFRDHGQANNFTYNWSYFRADGDPSPGEIHHQSGANVNQIRVHEQDNGLVDRTINLDNIGPGSEITMGISGYIWDVISASKTGDVYTFIVDPGIRANNGVSSFSFVYYTASALNYSYNTDLFVSDARISGYFGNELDGSNPAFINNNGYGIDINLQVLAASSNWEIVAKPTFGSNISKGNLGYWQEASEYFEPVTTSVGYLGNTDKLIQGAYFGDNSPVYFGDSQDASMLFDGADLIISGSGDLYYNSDLIWTAGNDFNFAKLNAVNTFTAGELYVTGLTPQYWLGETDSNTYARILIVAGETLIQAGASGGGIGAGSGDLRFTGLGGGDIGAFQVRYSGTDEDIYHTGNDSGLAHLAGIETFTGEKTFSSQIISTLATGTAPFDITSTTLVTNLNSDLWDGNQFSDYLNQAVRTVSDVLFNSLELGVNNQTTVTDIKLTGTSNIATDGNLFFFIDANNDSSSNYFTFRNNAAFGTGNELMRINEDGSVSVVTGPMTVAGDIVYHTGNDSNLAKINAANTFTSFQTIETNSPSIFLREVDTTTHGVINQDSGYFYIQASDTSYTGSGSIRFSGASSTNINGFQVRYGDDWQDIYHTGNDGSGSGLDADTLDGVQAADFLRSDGDDITIGYLTLDNTTDSNLYLDAGGSTYSSQLIFKYLGGEKGKIEYDHNSVTTSRKINFNVADSATTAMSIDGNGDLTILGNIVLKNLKGISLETTGAAGRNLGYVDGSNIMHIGDTNIQTDLQSNGTLSYNGTTLASGTIDTTSSQTITVVDGLITAIA